jgi:putative membrane protein (TIGR04086 family)
MGDGLSNVSLGETVKKIHWIRTLIGGFLAEALLILIVIPINMKFGQHALLYVAPVGSLATCFLFGWWVGGRVESRFVLHGVLVGVVAMLIYIGLTRAQPEPLAYVIAHVLKLVGGAAGGLVAGRGKSAA